MKEQRIATFLLAADPSTLLGGLNKLLMPKQKQSSLRKSAQTILATNTGPVIVVLGHDAQKVHGELYDLNVEFVLNTDYKKGSLSSLHMGLKNFVGAMDAFIVVSGEFTEVSSEGINTLVNYYRKSPGKMLATFHQGFKEHPVLLSADFINDIVAESKNSDRDVAQLFRRHPQYVHLIEHPEPRHSPAPIDYFVF